MHHVSKALVGVILAMGVVVAIVLVVHDADSSKIQTAKTFTTSDVAGVYVLNRPDLKESVRLRQDGTFVYHFKSTQDGVNRLSTSGTYRLVNGRVKCREALTDWQYAIGDDAGRLVPVVPPGSTLNVGRTLTRTQ